MSRTYRGALIGCGYASWFQLTAWSRIDAVEIVALSNRTRSKAEQRAAEFNVPAVYSDYREMLDTESLDFVDIATAPVVHLEQVREAAKRGLPVLCQKPIAATLAELREMIRICEEDGVRFMVNENGRFQPWFRQLKPLLDEGVIGQPHYVNFTTRAGWRPPLVDKLNPSHRVSDRPWMYERSRHITYELGVHFFDTLRYLFGEANSVYAQMRRVAPQVVGETLATIMLEMGEVAAVVDMSWDLLGRPAEVGRSGGYGEFRIEGGKGSFHLRNGLLQLLLKDGRMDARQYPPDWELLSYQAAQQHFVDCLRSGAEFETSGPETIKTMELVFGAYDSAAHNRVYSVGRDLERLG